MHKFNVYGKSQFHQEACGATIPKYFSQVYRILNEGDASIIINYKIQNTYIQLYQWLNVPIRNSSFIAFQTFSPA